MYIALKLDVLGGGAEVDTDDDLDALKQRLVTQVYPERTQIRIEQIIDSEHKLVIGTLNIVTAQKPE
jgi:hypothetical protein